MNVRFTVRIFAATLLLAVGVQAEIGDHVADGVTGQSSFTDSVALTLGPATFAKPVALAIDRSVTPNRVYVADGFYHRVLGWSDVDALVNGTPADVVIGQANFTSFGCNRQVQGQGTATLSSLCYPSGLAVDGSGRLYVADYSNHRVLVFNDPFGTDQVADFIIVPTNTGPYFSPKGLVLDAAGNLFIADTGQCRVLELDTPLTTDLAADRVYGQANFTDHSCNVSANLYFPEGVAVDSAGNLWVGTSAWVYEYDDALNSTTLDRRIGTNLCNGSIETAATTCFPLAVATDDAGRLYVGDSGNNRVLEFDTPLTVSQASRVFGQPDFVGPGGFSDSCNSGGPGAASLCTQRVTPLPAGSFAIDEAVATAVDATGRLYVADGWNHRVLRYDDPTGTDQVADLTLGHTSMTEVRKPLTHALIQPQVAVYGDTLLAIDASNSRIVVYPRTGYDFDYASNVIGQPDLQSTGCNTGGISATSLCNPSAAWIDGNGNLWVADSGNNRVLEYDNPWLVYDPMTQLTTVPPASRVYGQPDFSSNGCGGGQTGLCNPQGVAVDAGFNLYISDTGNNRVVHHENPLGDTTTAERVYGQTSFAGSACNAGGRSADSLCDPRDLFADTAGNLFVVDHGNNRVVVYDDVFTNGGGADRVFGQNGNLTTGGCGTAAGQLCGPTGIAMDQGGDLFIADTDNNRVLEYDDPLATDTDADRVFGQPNLTAVTCDSVSDHSLCQPRGVAVSSLRGSVVIADSGNNRVLRFDAPFCVSDYQLTPQTPRVLSSRPYAAHLKVRRGASAGSDMLTFRGRLVLLENDGFFEDNEGPLVTLSTASGVVYQEKVPWVTNQRSTANGGVWSFDYRDQPYQGIDYYRHSTRFYIPPGFGDAPQRDKIRYRGEAVNIDLSGFTDTAATFRLQFNTQCFTTQLSCRSTATGRRCRAAR
jgi:sugar lactone lactonase YvrE